jgi:hypothetical protein
VVGVVEMERRHLSWQRGELNTPVLPYNSFDLFFSSEIIHICTLQAYP